MIDIVDFRDSPFYKHAKLVDPKTRDMTDEKLVDVVLNHLERKEPTKVYKFMLKDAHTMSPDDHGRIAIPVGKKEMYDGIYDIWLRECENVTSITIVFAYNKIEVPVQEFKFRDDKSIQIPLAFMSDGDEVKHMFLEPKRRMSFIPSIALDFDKMFIQLNEGARCKVCISTLYCQRYIRMKLSCGINTFYVNGTPLVATGGMVHLNDNIDQCGCVIS
jgi:hypothetical protein